MNNYIILISILLVNSMVSSDVKKNVFFRAERSGQSLIFCYPFIRKLQEEILWNIRSDMFPMDTLPQVTRLSIYRLWLVFYGH